MKKITKMISVLSIGILAWGCTENEYDKVVLPYTNVVGEYVVDMHLSQPFVVDDHVTIVISNTAAAEDSLWLEDANFYESKVRVKMEGNKFFTTEGDDLLHGEVVNIEGEVFPEKDSIHVEWRYLQMSGDPGDDYVVEANGVIYNGITN
ncbi:hypothetical protein [Fulvivirga ligni]|uniref:hypothetical protein n=1 Tax=Fulvivirga ligni TaxID=2904246 RepID=UPI001F387D06|nr:hypothetical protein [Fulvivirga ligni]UII20181.1 hypothetical protein LVD16_20250 [Fulvivirga ligni]